MSGNIQDLNKELHRISGVVNETSQIASNLRQLSHAIVVSVYRDYGKCDIVLSKNGIGIKGAIVSMHPNTLNITGYPKCGDAVLVYHQSDSLDCHIMFKLHDKTKAFYKYETYANNCTLPAGALAG